MIKMIDGSQFKADWETLLPEARSKKGDNGKVLVIGGARLFHAPLKWTLTVLSKMVDMVFCASTEENNELLKEAKSGFWDGMVVKRTELEDYLREAEVVLMGPGMERGKRGRKRTVLEWATHSPTPAEWESETEILVNHLLAKYPEKKWILDAGAVQMIDPVLITESCILTPNQAEAKGLEVAMREQSLNSLPGGILKKGVTDQVYWQGELVAKISGGNAGMTKGGTGDSLAGLVAGLATKLNLRETMILGSEVCKKSGDELFKRVGPYFNASELAEQIPMTLWQMAKEKSGTKQVLAERTSPC